MYQDTYQLRDPETSSEWKSAYSQEWISAWDFPSQTPKVFDKPNMWLHEFCHVIEIWVRRPHLKERLLMRNYGYEFGKMTRTRFKTEAWVLALQRELSIDLFGVNPVSHEAMHLILTEFTKPVIGCNVSMEEFEEMLLVDRAEHVLHGNAFYYSAWQHACTYVKENRQPDVLWMLGM